MKLVSIGTVADVAELKGENRVFVKHGLKGLRNVSNMGLRSLIEGCGLGNRKISEGDLGFRIGPRINAAGRMGMTDLAVRLFFADDPAETLALVKKLDDLNALRQKTEEKIFNDACERVEDRGLDKKYKCLVLGSPDWHRGVIGIVASKLKDRFNRPVLLFHYENGKAHGSGRSISGSPDRSPRGLQEPLPELRQAPPGRGLHAAHRRHGSLQSRAEPHCRGPHRRGEP